MPAENSIANHEPGPNSAFSASGLSRMSPNRLKPTQSAKSTNPAISRT